MSAVSSVDANLFKTLANAELLPNAIPPRRAESVRPESARSESGRLESVRPESLRSESVRPESVRLESVRPESVRPQDATNLSDIDEVDQGDAFFGDQNGEFDDGLNLEDYDDAAYGGAGVAPYNTFMPPVAPQPSIAVGSAVQHSWHLPRAHAQHVPPPPSDVSRHTAPSFFDAALRSQTHAPIAPSTEASHAPYRPPAAAAPRLPDSDDLLAKQSVLMDLDRLRQLRGVTPSSREFTLNDRLEDITFELQRRLANIDEDSSISMMRDVLRLTCTGIEMATTRMGWLDLEGWSSEVVQEICHDHKYDPTLAQLYRKHFKRGRASSPEVQIAVGMVGSIGMFVVKKRIMGGGPGHAVGGTGGGHVPGTPGADRPSNHGGGMGAGMGGGLAGLGGLAGIASMFGNMPRQPFSGRTPTQQSAIFEVGTDSGDEAAPHEV